MNIQNIGDRRDKSAVIIFMSSAATSFLMKIFKEIYLEECTTRERGGSMGTHSHFMVILEVDLSPT